MILIFSQKTRSIKHSLSKVSITLYTGPNKVYNELKMKKPVVKGNIKLIFSNLLLMQISLKRTVSIFKHYLALQCFFNPFFKPILCNPWRVNQNEHKEINIRYEWCYQWVRVQVLWEKLHLYVCTGMIGCLQCNETYLKKYKF